MDKSNSINVNGLIKSLSLNEKEVLGPSSFNFNENQRPKPHQTKDAKKKWLKRV